MTERCWSAVCFYGQFLLGKVNCDIGSQIVFLDVTRSFRGLLAPGVPPSWNAVEQLVLEDKMSM